MMDKTKDLPAHGAPSFTVRPAVAGDLDDMTGLLREEFLSEAGDPFDAAGCSSGLQLLIDSPAGCVLVAEQQGRVVGMLAAQLLLSVDQGGWTGLIESIAVTFARRRQGVGRALLAAAGDWFRRQHVSQIRLLVDSRNVPAIIFCRKQEWLQTNLIALRRNL